MVVAAEEEDIRVPAVATKIKLAEVTKAAEDTVGAATKAVVVVVMVWVVIKVVVADMGEGATKVVVGMAEAAT